LERPVFRRERDPPVRVGIGSTERIEEIDLQRCGIPFQVGDGTDHDRLGVPEAPVDELDSLPERPNSISRVSTVDGRSVESVTSSIDDVVASTDSSFFGHAQVFFPANSPKLPYRLTDDTRGTEAGSPFSQQDSATFSKWSEHVKVTLPAGALPYSSLPPPDAA
jgi:hypothetical protein